MTSTPIQIVIIGTRQPSYPLALAQALATRPGARTVYLRRSN